MRYRTDIRAILRLDEFVSLRTEWDALVAASHDCPLFATYLYCEVAAADVLARGGRIYLVLIYDEHDTLLALWPLTIKRRGLWLVATHLSCGNGQETGGPLIRGLATSAILNEAVSAARRVDADVLEIAYLEDGSLLQQTLTHQPRPRFSHPNGRGAIGAFAIKLCQFNDIDEYYTKVLSAGLRRNLRRQLRHLKTIGRVEIGWCADVEDAVQVIAWMFEYKRRWAVARGIRTRWLLADRQVEDFFITLARRLDLSQTPLAAFVKLDGVPIAASVSWVGNRVHRWCITTFDQNYHRFGASTLLLEFLVRWSHAHGLDFDFGWFDVDYKARWSNQHSIQKSRYVIISRLGRLMEASLLATAVRSKLRNVLRDRLTRVKLFTQSIGTRHAAKDRSTA